MIDIKPGELVWGFYRSMYGDLRWVVFVTYVVVIIVVV